MLTIQLLKPGRDTMDLLSDRNLQSRHQIWRQTPNLVPWEKVDNIIIRVFHSEFRVSYVLRIQRLLHQVQLSPRTSVLSFYVWPSFGLPRQSRSQPWRLQVLPALPFADT